MGERMNVVGVGYEGKTIQEFCAHLVSLNVDTVVDARLNALSRKRGFSKNGLRAALAESGVDYLFFPGLGNHRENREGFAVPGSRAGDAARDRYRVLLATPQAAAALGTLAELVDGSTIAVMCFERDQHECHREIVIEQLNDLVEERVVRV